MRVRFRRGGRAWVFRRKGGFSMLRVDRMLALRERDRKWISSPEYVPFLCKYVNLCMSFSVFFKPSASGWYTILHFWIMKTLLAPEM